MNLADILRGQHQPPSDADLEVAAARVLLGNQAQLVELCGVEAASALLALASKTLNPESTP